MERNSRRSARVAYIPARFDRSTVGGDKSVLSRQVENAAGVWISNYVAKTIVVRSADIQGMRVGVTSPFYQEFRAVEPSRCDGSVAIDGGYFRNYIGVSVATVY